VQHDAAPRWSPARLAYGFYAVAATGAVIGQTWVAYTHVPWPPAVPAWVRVAAVLPFALCLELLAMALAAMADQRMRLGEGAYGFRIFSAMVATVAVGILVLGHWPRYYWSASFGVLSTSAYMLWLLHSAARRRDALRAAGKLADTAPDYGMWRRLRYPIWTARAAELAREGTTDPTGQWRPLSLYESLRAAQATMRADQRRPAIAKAVEQVVRADHEDPRMAEIAVHTLDLDRLATHLESLVDYPAWANRLAPAITVATSTPATPDNLHTTPEPADRASRTGGPGRRDGTVARRRRVIVRSTRVDPTQALFASVLTHPALVGAAPDPTRPRLRAVPPVDDNATGTHHLPHPDANARDGVPEVKTADATAAIEGPATVPVLTTGPGPVDDGVDPPPAPAAPATADDGGDGDATDLSQTAAAVISLHTRDPGLRASEIAARVGCSARHVRRILNAIDNPDAAPTPPDVLADTHR
jgi:hypothetical protein